MTRDAETLLALLQARSPRSLQELRETMSSDQAGINAAAMELADLGHVLEVGPALALISEPAAREDVA